MKTLEPILENIDSSIDELIKLGKEATDTHAFYTFDLYNIGILNRTVNLIRGFTSLMRDKNFIAAAPLVRIHLDSLLRLYAATLVSYNIDEFALKIIGGKQISNLKDREGNYMKDGYLARQFAIHCGEDWIIEVYKAGSGHIHFSNAATKSAIRIKSESDRIMLCTIGKHDEFISENEKIGAAIRFHQISVFIASLVTRWMEQKQKYKTKPDKT
jgi:hypothetical protein